MLHVYGPKKPQKATLKTLIIFIIYIYNNMYRKEEKHDQTEL